MPSQCDARRAIIAGTTFMKGENREPAQEDESRYDPGGHHLTDRFSQPRRPALWAHAISSHVRRLHLVLDALDTELCYHRSVRSGSIAGYFTITCTRQVPPEHYVSQLRYFRW